ncbi:MAG: lipoyl(octanoyl) transferase LipB [Chloroflexi bacterium]|nr:lipoyl(octanoyl) transferase LipB [Chloroflexota bacterium]
MNQVWLVNLPAVPYADALALQHRVVAARKRGALNDTLLLLEHPAVFTLGRNANDGNILVSPEHLKKLGIEVFRVERGGDVTYHGPGQLVGYPILDLHNFRTDVGWFVRSIEETLIRVLEDFGIHGKRIEKLVGVWVDQASPVQPEAKVVQIGARIEQWITYHGFALNVDPNVAHFDLIVPCGISDKAVTSMARVLQKPVDAGKVRASVAARFGEVFGAEMVPVSAQELYERLGEEYAGPTPV